MASQKYWFRKNSCKLCRKRGNIWTKMTAISQLTNQAAVTYFHPISVGSLSDW